MRGNVEALLLALATTVAARVRQTPRAAAIIFLIGSLIGAVLISHAGVWGSADVAPAVLAAGLGLPVGWLGIAAIRR